MIKLIKLNGFFGEVLYINPNKVVVIQESDEGYAIIRFDNGSRDYVTVNESLIRIAELIEIATK